MQARILSVLLPGRPSITSTCKTPTNSISNDQSQYDYAVIHLSQSFAGLGTMGLEAAFEGGNAIVSGYPGYLNGAIENSQE